MRVLAVLQGRLVYSNPTQLNLFMGEPAFEYQFTKAGTAVFRRRR